MAGIGLRFGLPTRLVLNAKDLGAADSPLTVLNADTRSLPEAEAIAVIKGIVATLHPDVLLFKKIDSVLRGHVAAEINALLSTTSRYDRVLLLSQNPTRGRVVRPDGMYYVEGVPLARTAFAADPDHPARTSNAMDRVARSVLPARLCQDSGIGLEAGRLNLAPAETFEAVGEWSRAATLSTLLVGAADLFTATLMKLGYAVVDASTPPQFKGPRLYLCGSTSTSARRLLRTFATSNGIEVASTADRARESLLRAGVAVVMSPEPGGVEEDPRDVELALGQIAQALVTQGLCDWVFAEGGATATAVCRALQWTSVDVEAELATGVVVLKPAMPVRFVIKPGSYMWPENVVRLPRTS